MGWYAGNSGPALLIVILLILLPYILLAIGIYQTVYGNNPQYTKLLTFSPEANNVIGYVCIGAGIIGMGLEAALVGWGIYDKYGHKS